MVQQLVTLALAAQFLSFGLSAAQGNPEAGAFFSREYSPKIYGAALQNWAVVQDQQGVIYVGNNEGILEYDGQRWRKLELPNLSTVRSLAVDAQGTVYVGGQEEIGFLKADNTGTLQYVSLLNHIDPQDRVFNDVWSTLATSSGVVFGSNQRIFRWSAGQGMKVWKPSSSFSAAFLADDIPYFINKGSGLCALVDDSIRPVPGGEIFSGSPKLRGVFRFMGSLMVATPDALYIQKGAEFHAYDSEAKALLQASVIYRCLPLEDGRLVIGTVQQGAILLDAQGKILRILDSAGFGLRGNSINGMYVDREGGLWLALNNGLARVDVSGAVTRFTEREGLAEVVPSIQRQDGVLYAGTMAGLARLVPNKKGTPRFEAVAGIHGQVLALLSTPHGLLVGAPGGLYEVTKSGVQELSSEGAVRDLALSVSDSSTAYAAGRGGLFVLRLKNGRWQQALYIDSGGAALLSVAEGLDRQVWATTLSDIWRFDLRASPVKVDRFSKQQGVPNGWKHAYRVNGSVVFATGEGLFRFDSQTSRFVADASLGRDFANGSRRVSTILQGPDGDIWISGEGYHRSLRRKSDGGYLSDENILGNSGVKELYAVYVDLDGTVWASGTDGGVVRYEPSLKSGKQAAFQALLRQVQIVGHERSVFGGAKTLVSMPKLKYQENALHFDFAAPIFEGVSEMEFRVMLEGLDHAWSPWTTEAEKEYTNLWEGKYAFHVQARDLTRRASRESVFAFRVLPPLYRRWWAYVLYLALALAGVWLITKWRLAAIEAQNRRLEMIVEERTEEIRLQRDEIRAQEKETESLLLNILPSAVAHELRTTGEVKPLSCENVTVCFTDFVGFTKSSEDIPAADLVTALNRYFTEFDRIVSGYGLEKIKTIGDSYMFASGLPQARASHAVDAVLAALEIVEAAQRLAKSSHGWRIRVGLHSGPVVAGVVGLRKFAFDIWGKTVNFASRHESSGQPDAVNISAQTHELIAEFFHCEARGPVLIKEGRYLDMHRVRGVHQELCPATLTDTSLFENLYRERFGLTPPRLPDLSRVWVVVPT